MHVAEGKPHANGTKIWITSAGKCLLAHNNSKIPDKALKNIMRLIEARSEDVIQKWKDFFGEIRFYQRLARKPPLLKRGMNCVHPLDKY